MESKNKNDLTFENMLDSKGLKELVDSLIVEAHELIPKVIAKTKGSDDRAKEAGAKWIERHRLHVLLDAVEESSIKLSENILVEPIFLAELKATLEVIHRWHDQPLWKEIEPSLETKTHFTHTISKLHVAEYFQRQGHKVELFPRGGKKSPDLKVQAIGSTQDWLLVECYQPQKLHGGQNILTEKKWIV